MRQPICTIDASTAIALDWIDVFSQLSFLFSRILLPKAVRTELFRRRTMKDRVRSRLDSLAFFERCDDYDQTAVDILLIERGTLGLEDRGEAEAVVQAAERGAMVLVDDAWGRKLAERLECDVHGTFWVIC